MRRVITQWAAGSVGDLAELALFSKKFFFSDRPHMYFCMSCVFLVYIFLICNLIFRNDNGEILAVVSFNR